MTDYQTQTRIPIRKRVLKAVLLTTLLAAFVAMAFSLITMLRIKDASETTLTDQLKQNLKSLVEQKTINTEARLKHYEMYIEFISDYINEMYTNRTLLIDKGKLIDAPRKTTPKYVFAMQGGLAINKITPDDVVDDIKFFSHLENIWQPIAKENDELINTVYVGTKSGFLPSYDKWSHLSAVPEGEYFYYNFKNSEWYKVGMEQNEIFYTKLYQDTQGRGLTITIGKSFHDTKWVRQGVACADFNLTGLYAEMTSIHFGAGTKSFLFAQDGQLIVTEGEDQDPSAVTGLSRDEIRTILAKKNGILEKTDAFYIYDTVPRVHWTLCASVPRSVVLEGVREMDRTIWTAILLFLAGVVFISIALTPVANALTASITRPLEQLGADMNEIGDGNLSHRAAITSNDEVGDIAVQFNTMVDRLNSTNNSLKLSEELAEKMSELATRDALTGIRNRTAYEAEIQKIEKSIALGTAAFGVVMMDLNFLKQTNDVYGHELGNLAIKGLCSVVCDVFVHSPVFRIGGDEFVVIVKSNALKHMDELISEFNRRITQLQQDPALEPWEKVSAAVGYARFNKDIDKGYDSVFKHADMAMYEHKKSMKAIRIE